MLLKSPYFEFLNRRAEPGFATFLEHAVEDQDYINWNGYALPYDFGDAEFEYRTLRDSCAVCDVTPMCNIRIRGADAGRFLDRLLTRPVSQLAPMRTTYTVYCHEDGSLIDDSIVYKFADDDYVLMPSDIDHTPYFEALRDTLGLTDVTFEMCSDDWSGLAVQGPKSAAVMQQMGCTDAADLKPFEVRRFELDGHTMLLARMGFTADLGYELWGSPDAAETVMQKLQAARSALDLEIPGYALTAIDVCRMEGGMIVAGWDFATDLDPELGMARSPLEVGLGWLVNFDADDFPGREALRQQREQGLPNYFRTFSIEASATLGERAVVHSGPGDDQAAIGIVTSSCWSWGLGKTIGNVSIENQFQDVETAWVHSREDWLEMTLRKGPMLDIAYRNQTPAPTD